MAAGLGSLAMGMEIDPMSKQEAFSFHSYRVWRRYAINAFLFLFLPCGAVAVLGADGKLPFAAVFAAYAAAIVASLVCSIRTVKGLAAKRVELGLPPIGS